MAQSNVAVKNIAEKLMDIGFEDWTLLISVDFHFEWLVLISEKCFSSDLLFSSGMNTSTSSFHKIIFFAQINFPNPQLLLSGLFAHLQLFYVLSQ